MKKGGVCERRPFSDAEVSGSLEGELDRHLDNPVSDPVLSLAEGDSGGERQLAA